MPREGFRLLPSEIAHIAPSVDPGIAVEELPVEARFGDADPVAVPWHWGEIEDEDEEIFSVPGPSDKGHDALFIITEVDPFETFASEIQFVEGRLSLVYGVEVFDEGLKRLMRFFLQEMPIETRV